MNKLLAASALICAAFGFSVADAQVRPAAIVTAPAPAVTLAGAERDAALAQASRALNNVQTLQGRFLQNSPDGGRLTGAFYLQRPGKLRFEYDPPATLLIISDGRVVSMRDRSLRTTDRTPLRSTPLNLILRAQVNLAADARITRVARQGAALFVSARDRSGLADGEITLRFDGPAAQLSSWDVVDGTGARTQIALSNVVTPASIDPRLFRMEDILEPRRGIH